ncbi:hypothetical protein ACHAQD_009230 [Fusarium lateritium]
MEVFNLIEGYIEDNGRKCDICGERLVDSQANLEAHKRTHTGLAAPEVVDGKTTWSGNHAAHLRTKIRPDDDTTPPPIIERVQKFLLSKPAKVRRFGGKFDAGVLAGEKVTGMAAYFDKQGTLKKKFTWMKPLGIVNPFKQHVQTAAIRSRRPCNVRLGPAHKNTKWMVPTEGTFAAIHTNLYTPSKFPGWKKPRGWNLDWPMDPTYIPQNLPQCSLCNTLACRCILEKVSQSIPSIVDAESMGRGIVATVSYKVGDLIGELIGEITPLSDKTGQGNGWSITLGRDDLVNEKMHNVCEIQCINFGNWVRLVNHSCEQNVQFIEMPISGRWRIILEVVKPIAAGQDVVTSYGEDYFMKGDMKCLCGTESCFEKRRK